jgi:hypothetical protein
MFVCAAMKLPCPPFSNAVWSEKPLILAPFYYRKMENCAIMSKTNRKRSVQLIVRVTEDEKALIYQKMALLQTQNLAAYARKMLIDGYIINVDYSIVKDHAAQLQHIGNNVNQIVKRMHQTGSLYADDVAEVKKILHDIWLSERRLLLRCRIDKSK